MSAMCSQKVVDRKTTEEHRHAGVEGNFRPLATANGVRWFRQGLRRYDDSVLRVSLESEWQDKSRITAEDLEVASGRGDREDWFEEGGCPETSRVERRSSSNCRRNGVNSILSAKMTIPDKN